MKLLATTAATAATAAAAAAITATPALAGTPTPQTTGAQAHFVGCGGSSLVHPREFDLFCGDGNDVINHLRWSHWGQARTTATGIETENTCVPDCAAGHNTRHRVSITLSELSGGRYHLLRVGRHRFDLTEQGPSLA